MENVIKLFSEERNLPVELSEIIREICSAVETLEEFSKKPIEIALDYQKERYVLWNKLEELLELEIYYDIEFEDFMSQSIIENGRMFRNICDYLPAYSGLNLEFLILPNGFVVGLMYQQELVYFNCVQDVAKWILEDREKFERYLKDYEDEECMYDD